LTFSAFHFPRDSFYGFLYPSTNKFNISFSRSKYSLVRKGEKMPKVSKRLELNMQEEDGRFSPAATAAAAAAAKAIHWSHMHSHSSEEKVRPFWLECQRERGRSGFGLFSCDSFSPFKRRFSYKFLLLWKMLL